MRCRYGGFISLPLIVSEIGLACAYRYEMRIDAFGDIAFIDASFISSL